MDSPAVLIWLGRRVSVDKIENLVIPQRGTEANAEEIIVTCDYAIRGHRQPWDAKRAKNRSTLSETASAMMHLDLRRFIKHTLL